MPNKSESVLPFYYFILLVISSIFLILVSITNMSNVLADSFLKKSLAIMGLVSLIFTVGIYKGAIANYVAFFSPLLLDISRPYIFYNNFITLPTIFNHKSIGLLECYVFVTFLVFLFVSAKGKLKNSAINNYIIFLSFAVISIFWAISPQAAIPKISILLVFPASYVIFYKIFSLNPKAIFYFFSGLLFAALLTSITAWPAYLGFHWFDFLTNKDTDELIAGQLRTGGLLSKTDLAHFLVVCIPVLTGYLISIRKDFSLKLKILILLFLLLTLTLTFNRAQLALSMFGIGLIVLKARKVKLVKIKTRVLIFLVFITLIFMFLISQMNVVSVQDILLRDTLAGRLQQYTAGIIVGINNLAFGVGVNNFLLTNTAVSILGANSWELQNGISIHNEYIKIFSELGIVGLGLFIYFARSIYKKYKFNASFLSYAIRVNFLAVLLLALPSSPFSRPEDLFLLGVYLAVLDYEKWQGKLGTIYA